MLNKWGNEFSDHKQHTTFSSTLLDQIYRSLSETDPNYNNEDHLKFYTDTIMPTKQDRRRPSSNLIPKWIDHNHNIQKSLYLDHHLDLDQDSIFFSSTSISSDSSSLGFSSSETESIYTAKSKSKSKSSCSANSALPIRPKPVRTTVSSVHRDFDYGLNSSTDETPKLNQSIFKSKSRAALKIYNKVKQPISPGGKLANFINSIFTNGNSKKSNYVPPPPCSVYEDRKLKSGQASSTCSSASKSCLSKSQKFPDGVKRNVRFYPVSVMVDEDCRTIGNSPSKKTDNELKYQVMEKSRKVEQVARDILREYNKKNENQIMKNTHHFDDQEDDDFDDSTSYSSSDLFELDHLSVIGKDRYCEELPVYETTRLHTNRAIAAKGLIM